MPGQPRGGKADRRKGNTMTEHKADRPESADGGVRGISRRSVLGGLAAALVAPALVGKAWARGGEPLGRSRPLNEQFDAQAPEQIGAGPARIAPLPRFGHSATTLGDGRILVAGGWRQGGTSALNPPLAAVQIYDPAGDVWAGVASLKTARAEHAAVALPDGRVLVLGGLRHAPLADAEVYDPARDTWTRIAPMGQARYGHAATVSEGLVIVTGGFAQQPQTGVLVYDVAAEAWRPGR